MNKCRSYYTRESFDIEQNEMKEIGFCMSTKDCEPCTCGGEPNKCDFYKSKRKEEKKMNFAEVWLEAQDNDKWYINKSNSIVYNKDKGLVEKDYLDTPVEVDNFDFGIESIMRAEWEVWETTVMSRREAEDKYGIKIIG